MEKCFQNLVVKFKDKVKDWNSKYAGKIEFVYNAEQMNYLDFSQIKYILIGDNPGKNEKDDKKYFADGRGANTAGSNARRFFAYLGVDFDKEILVLNKTPMFTKSTLELRQYKKGYKGILAESQRFMAELANDFHKCLRCKMYITGLSGCYYKKGKVWILNNESSHAILPEFFLKIKELYNDSDLKYHLFIFKHFSYWKVFSDGNLNMKKIENSNIPIDEVTKELESTKYISELLKK